MTSFNYNKWDNIELSDDESDCHPNIDKQSWFRMKHRSRVEREARDDDEKTKLQKASTQDQERIDELAAKMAAEAEDGDDHEALEEELKDLEGAIEKRDARLAEMEKNKKWNVDNMCHVVEERTIIGKQKDKLTTSELPPDLAAAQEARERQAAMAKALESSDKAAAEPSASSAAAAAKVVAGPTPVRSVHSYAEFVDEHEDLLEAFSNLASLEATEAMLKAKGDVLLVEHASSYLLLSCLEEEMNSPGSAKMKQVARQSQVLSHVSELGLSLHRPSRDVVVPFFRRIGEKEHGAAFADAVAVFVARIQARAVDKRKEMDEARARKQELGEGDEGDEEQEEMSREERMGPGGLDPVEVFATLPEALQEAFQSQDTQRLRDAIAALPLEDAKRHMKRCEDSGLWVAEK